MGVRAAVLVVTLHTFSGSFASSGTLVLRIGGRYLVLCHRQCIDFDLLEVAAASSDLAVLSYCRDEAIFFGVVL